MFAKNPVQPNFIKSLLFIALAGISFSAVAEHHGNAAHKAKKAVEVEMEKSPADKKAAMKAASPKKEKAAKVQDVETVMEAQDVETVMEAQDVEKAMDEEAAEKEHEAANPDG